MRLGDKRFKLGTKDKVTIGLRKLALESGYVCIYWTINFISDYGHECANLNAGGRQDFRQLEPEVALAES